MSASEGLRGFGGKQMSSGDLWLSRFIALFVYMNTTGKIWSVSRELKYARESPRGSADRSCLPYFIFPYFHIYCLTYSVKKLKYTKV